MSIAGKAMRVTGRGPYEMPMQYDVEATVVVPTVGRRYRLRNGAEVEINRKLVFEPPEPARRIAVSYTVMAGHYLGTTTVYTCDTSGSYAPPGCGIHPHELDIVGKLAPR